MRIVFCVSAMCHGGAEKVVSTLSNSFCCRGNDVGILMISKNNGKSFYQLDSRVKLASIPSTKNVFLKVKLLREKILEIKPDIVISFLPHVNVYMYFALKKTNIPLILSERNDPGSYPLYLKLLSKYVFKKCDGAIFQTDYAEKYYFKKEIKTNRVIFNPVMLNTTNKHTHMNNHIVFTVGRLMKQKNHLLLLKAIKKVKERIPDVSLKIFGDGVLQEELSKFIAKNNMSEYVDLCGVSKEWHVTELNNDLFVLSSDYEGMPNALEEALCLGIPCVSTNCRIGGPYEFSKFVDNLVLCKTKSVNALASAIENSLLENELVSNSNDLESLVSIENITNEWISYLSFIVNKRKNILN